MVVRPLSLTLSAPLHQLGVPWMGPWALKGMGPGLGFFPGRGPEAGSSAGQQRAGTLALRGSLDHSLLSAQVDEAGALMAMREVLTGMGWSLPWSDLLLPPS